MESNNVKRSEKFLIDLRLSAEAVSFAYGHVFHFSFVVDARALDIKTSESKSDGSLVT